MLAEILTQLEMPSMRTPTRHASLACIERSTFAGRSELERRNIPDQAVVKNRLLDRQAHQFQKVTESPPHHTPRLLFSGSPPRPSSPHSEASSPTGFLRPVLSCLVLPIPPWRKCPTLWTTRQGLKADVEMHTTVFLERQVPDHWLVEYLPS